MYGTCLVVVLTIWWMWCWWLPSSTLSCDESCCRGGVVSVLMLSLMIFAWLTFCDRFVGNGTPNGSNCMLMPACPSMLPCSSDVRSVEVEPEPLILFHGRWIYLKLNTEVWYIYLGMWCRWTLYEDVFDDWRMVILFRVMVFASVADGDADADGVAVVADDIVVGIRCCPTSIQRHYSPPSVRLNRMICYRIWWATPGPAFRPALWF